MTTCRLTVRTPEGAWQGEVDSWTSLVVLAALSAEPEALAELVEAVRRYQPEHRLFEAPSGAAAADGPWCLIDLAGRTVVAGGGFELPEPRAAYEADEADHAVGFPVVWLDTPADWLFREAGTDWQEEVATRSAARAAAWRGDVRSVLFGPPLLEHLAAGTLTAAVNGAPDEEHQQKLTRSIHADWLLTARADLGGRTPRAVLLADRSRIVWDMEHRQEQWHLQKHAAPPLSAESSAFRFGGFGTIEVVLYFDLVRELLADTWEQTTQDSRPTQPELVERLAAVRDDWLDSLNAEIGLALTPAELIETERRRLPVTSDGSHLDCDCPICQAMAEGEFGPAFLCFDGHHLELEDEFAFSMCPTREEWERQQEEYQRRGAELDSKTADEAIPFGADDADPLAGSAWQSSFVDWDAMAGEGAAPRQVLLALSFPLAELGTDLRDRPDGMDRMRSLNEAYRRLRAGQDAVATDSSAQELRDLLEAVSRDFPELTTKCADLQSRLDEVLRRIS